MGMESVFYGFETLKQKIMSTEKDLNYWKANAEEDYKQVPISVLRYITELETAVKNCSIPHVSQRSELLPEFLMKDLDGKIITAYVGGADVTKEWKEYLGNCG